ncbi:thiosulfate oxidation carrier protein SoxY [Sulfuricurvum sp. IAE1]|jgi:sulfur-oxidizing protein SoxY|uniref:thiosulfate oxidation carrier protein SoxY n=1 Tax=Sulfuricurvum sp. IAE1 TaxID=2546102 RepID=UPI00104BADB0|nr:thiosulfate oxidation carrier protein SoxY [Sulfuricurvum sp. IAE1]MDX9965575.1 thiosulfate oxidation carrier protein SoxY [Sulfuricurvum sp.]TDA62908.1 thiosulfate oxidation carrier protein SoxY [Sulfuricurvum sp. IAE1]
MERRSFLKGFGAAAACAAVLPHIASAAEEKRPAGPNEMNYNTAVAAITGGKPLVASAKVKMEAPEIAENGAVVPVKVTVESPMTQKDYVKAIHVLASKNGNVRCANIYLTPANGEAFFGTRVKLGGTQDVVAIAEMSDGTFLTAKQNVKVTIGGCG